MRRGDHITSFMSNLNEEILDLLQLLDVHRDGQTQDEYLRCENCCQMLLSKLLSMLTYESIFSQ